MTEQEAITRMVSPGMRRLGKPAGGVIQICITSSCNLACFNCTQASQLSRRKWFMSPEQFEQAVESLAGYFGTVGVFGGNPCLHKDFVGLCEILRKYFPKDQCGLWSNNPINVENAQAARITFNPTVSNLNVHLDRDAFNLFRQHWPEARPFGLHDDSRHSPPFVAMRDVLRKQCPECNGLKGESIDTGGVNPWGAPTPEEWVKCGTCNGTGQVYDEARAWELISRCPINAHWSAMLCVVEGKLSAFFCEIAGAMAMLHPEWPNHGVDPRPGWWKKPMQEFSEQVRTYCHSCGVPMQGRGELAQAKEGKEQTSKMHTDVYKPKRVGRRVELVTVEAQLGQPLENMTRYVQNAKI